MQKENDVAALGQAEMHAQASRLMARLPQKCASTDNPSMPWLAGLRELILRCRPPPAAGHFIPILIGQIVV
jgi:hypothetical protein